MVTTTDECGFILDLVYFARESSEISRVQAPVIESTAETFRCFARTGEITRWQVIGYTDDAERHGAELAHARAQAVIDALVARGVSANSLEAVSAAATDPLDRRGTPDARAKNRRVAFLRSR